ncbi:ATP-dependent Clp protease ATP-binding subunit-like protein [Frankliniella fusca]|uniref:ATP-dependent Clp protease ATP-binding subunit-like protein n=1 Tax=Frankliniella fusca TaxID=407009 RepID=A0AAE1GZU8_9NEOP|nr:ATP-dependent Clp protease ATP-binding subunit-like protein [Frankliniella fusca]
MSKLDDLLHKLKPACPNMPLSYSTLFQCDYNFDITELPSGGMFWFKGFSANLAQLDLTEYLKKHKKIVFDINMEGLPLRHVKLWPILAYLVGTLNDPFIIGVYRGLEEPKDVNDFKKKKCSEELKGLIEKWL